MLSRIYRKLANRRKESERVPLALREPGDTHTAGEEEDRQHRAELHRGPRRLHRVPDGVEPGDRHVELLQGDGLKYPVL